MRCLAPTSPHAILTALALLSACGHASETRNGGSGLFSRDNGEKGFIALSVDTVNRQMKGLSKRDAIEVTLQNKDFFYAMTLELGTPGQKVTVLVDTGSAELWVNPDCSTAPSLTQQAQCQNFGRYVPENSKTPAVGPFSGRTIRYGDASDPTTHTSVQIEYYADSLQMGTAVMTNQTFGVVVQSDGQSQGILGIAPDIRAGFTPGQPYSLVLNTMADEGIINSRVFTLDLRHADSETGAVIYGGLDKSKFTGPLTKVALAKGNSGEFRLGALLTSVSLTDAKGVNRNYTLSQSDANVMLDSGTTLTRLHRSLAYPILQDLSARMDSQGYYLTNCSYRDSAATVNFGFGADSGSGVVRVPLRDFILDLGQGGLCYIGLVLTTDQQILGDSVLRAGYFVFDWDNQAVHVAQAANCGTDITSVGKGPSAVPSATGNCDGTDAVSATGSVVRSEALSQPTAAYTTVYTVTSCPLFDTSCQTGVLTTQTILPTLTGGGSATPTTASSGTSAAAGLSRPLSTVMSMAAMAVAVVVILG